MATTAQAEQLCGEVSDEQIVALDLAHAAYMTRTGKTLTRQEWVFDAIKQVALNEILLAEDMKLQAVQAAEQQAALEASVQAMAASDVAKKEIIEQSEAW